MVRTRALIILATALLFGHSCNQMIHTECKYPMKLLSETIGYKNFQIENLFYFFMENRGAAIFLKKAKFRIILDSQARTTGDMI